MWIGYCALVSSLGRPGPVPLGWLRSGAPSVRKALSTPGRQGLLLACLVLVCAGASINFGDYTPVALGCELLAIALLALACTAEDRPISRWSWLVGLYALSVCDLMYTLGWSPLEAAFAALALASAVLVTRAHPSRIRRVVAITAASAAVAGTVIVGFRAGIGRLDVFNELVRSASALIHGHNPYGPLTPLYIAFDPRTGAINGIPEHFSYLPVAALIAVPGELIGDPRFSTVAVAALIGAAMLALWRRADGDLRPRAEHALLLALLFPMLPGMIVFAFVDLEIAAGIAVWLALRERSRVAAVLALGLGMCIKPTSWLLLLPLAMRSRRHAVEMAAGLATALIVALPFAIITGFSTLVYAVLGVELKESYRPVSLAISAPLYQVGLSSLPLIIPLAALLLALIHLLRHRPHSRSAALTGAAFIGLVSCVFNAFAYFNYYTLVTALILLALLAPGRPGLVATDAAAARPGRFTDR
jgi:hypothetical protein